MTDAIEYEDLRRVWRLLLSILHQTFLWIDHFASTASVTLGFVLLVLALLVKIYQRRRRFYGGINVAADWEPTYGSIVFARMFDTGLTIAFRLLVLLGLMVLFRWYLPVLFEDIAGFFVRITG